MSLAGIQMAARSLLAHERSLEVTGQNIANAQTPGYSRQVAVARSVTGPGGATNGGTGAGIAASGGVDIVAVSRTHAAWLDRSAAALSARVGGAGVSERFAARVESLLGEPGPGGLQSTLGKFFDAASGLASQPDSASARQTLLNAGAATATRLRELTDGLDTVRSEAVQTIRNTVEQVNGLTGQIAALNGSIIRAQSAGAAPNEMLDQRDQLVSQLTSLTGATVNSQEGGALVISLAGRTLVQGDRATELALKPGDAFGVVEAGSGEDVFIPGGELQALTQWGSSTLPALRADIAAVRDSLAAAVNSVHRSGTGRDGSTNLDFFTTNADGDLQVNPALSANPLALAAGDGSAGDGSKALALAALGSASGSIQQGYGALVARIGATAADSRYASDEAQLSLEQVQGMQQSETGVNLDEELAHMVSLQHAYSASARLLSTFDQMLDTVISLGR